MYRTRRRSWVITLSTAAVFCVGGRTARAQQTGVAVQLPTFSYFSVNTSVLVPDSGAGIAAAMRREEANRIMYGPGPNVARARAASTSGVTVRATIHDPATEPGLVLDDPAERGAQAALSRRFEAAGGSSAGRADLSVTEIKRQRARAGDQDQADALRYFERGRAAESKGQFGVAAIYYRQAATRASGELRTAAIKQLKVVAAAH